MKNEIRRLTQFDTPVGGVFKGGLYKVSCYVDSHTNNLLTQPQTLGNDGALATKEYKSYPTLAKTGNGSAIEPFGNVVLGVPALPWTSAAGDDVVSELISQYFTFDYLYVFPPIQRSMFTREMMEGNPPIATCCTPLLVNAICAQQCVSSKPSANLLHSVDYVKTSYKWSSFYHLGTFLATYRAKN